MAMYCAVQGPTPGSVRSCSTASSRPRGVPSASDPSRVAIASARIAPARARVRPARPRSAPASASGVGKRWLRPSFSGPAIGSPNALARRPASVRGAADRDLLAEDRPDRQLEGVPRPWHTHAGQAPQAARERWVSAQMGRDAGRINREVEEAIHALYDRQQIFVGAQLESQLERVRRWGPSHLERAPAPPDRHGPPIRTLAHRLDPWRGAFPQETQKGRPCEGRPIGKLQAQAGRGTARPTAPQLARCLVKCGAHGRVEGPDAREARAVGELGDR